MRTTLCFAALLSAVCFPAAQARAQDAGAAAPADTSPPPPADEIKRVLDYYYNGKDRGPALVELKACLKVDSGKGPTQHECIEPVTGTVKKDTTVHGWTMWYLPEGASYDDVVLQFLHNNDVRSTVDVKLSTGGRTRTWRSTTASKKGKWTIKVKRGDQELGSTSFNVE